MVTKLGLDNSFMLFGANGMMEQNERVHISKGTRIFAFGYGMNEQQYVVYNDNMDAVEICTGDPKDIDQSDLDRYFSPKHHLEETIRPISKQFGIGFYYDESDDVIGEDIIEKSLQRAENLDRLEHEVEEEKERKDEETREKLIKEYNYLKRAEGFDHKTCGANIRTELKKNFPNTKFSVRYSSFSGGDSYDIDWTDGPTTKQVDAIVKKYSDMHPDSYSMGDYWDCVPSIFNALFGSVGYVMTHRDISEEAVGKVIEELEATGVNEENCKDYRAYKEGSEEQRLVARETPRNLNEVARWICHNKDLSIKVEQKQKKEPVTVEAYDVRIIDYSEKSFAVVGNTRPIKEDLKRLGGRFNAKLNCGCGWIFSNSRRAQVEELVNK